jgi:hypothetical protein
MLHIGAAQHLKVREPEAHELNATGVQGHSLYTADILCVIGL